MDTKLRIKKPSNLKKETWGRKEKWIIREKISGLEEKQERKTGRRNGQQMLVKEGPTRNYDPINLKFSSTRLGRENLALQRQVGKTYRFAGQKMKDQLIRGFLSDRPLRSTARVF